MSILSSRDIMVSDYCGSDLPSLDDVRESFSHHAMKPVLQPQAKPCDDCAVTGGLYIQVSAYLSLLPRDEIAFHSDRWFCHDNPDCSCRGNINYQAAIAKATGKT